MADAPFSPPGSDREAEPTRGRGPRGTAGARLRGPMTGRLTGKVVPAIATLGVTAALMLPFAAVPALQGHARLDVRKAGELAVLLANLCIVASALLLFWDWRTSRSPQSGVVGAGMAFLAVQELPFALSDDPLLTPHTYELSRSQVTIAIAVALLVLAGRRRPSFPHPHPFALGIVAAVGVVAVRATMVRVGADPLVEPDQWLGLAGAVVAVLLVAGATLVTFRRDTQGWWVWRPIGCALTIWFAARLWAVLVEEPGPPVPTVVLIALAAAIALVVSSRRLRATVNAQQRQFADYAHRVAHIESVLRQTRERVHAMNDTVAAVVAGAELLTQQGGAEGERAARLRTMVDAEMARLRRMTARPWQESNGLETTPIDLDEMIDTIVTAQHALGHEVKWEPAGHQVLADPDAVAEALTTLLTNASRHAGGAGTRVVTEQVDDMVTITVSDEGPGIPEWLVPVLFDRGTRGHKSQGSGIGLHVARRLILQQGGSLVLGTDEGSRSGATFVITLPAPPQGRTRRAQAPGLRTSQAEVPPPASAEENQ